MTVLRLMSCMRGSRERFPEIGTVTMDAGYKTPWICKRVLDDGRLPSLPYKRPMTKEGFHEWYKYVYDEYLDIVICPEYKSLRYSTTNRDGYREYKSLELPMCRNCPTRKSVHRKQERSEGGDAPCLGGLYRTVQRISAIRQREKEAINYGPKR